MGIWPTMMSGGDDNPERASLLHGGNDDTILDVDGQAKEENTLGHSKDNNEGGVDGLSTTTLMARTASRLRYGCASAHVSDHDALVGENEAGERCSNGSRRRRVLWIMGSVLLVTVAIVSVVTGIQYGFPAESLKHAVTVAGIHHHLDALQDIANKDPHHSRAVQYGYEASAEYVETVLREAGVCAGGGPKRQYFKVPIWYEQATTPEDATKEDVYDVVSEVVDGEENVRKEQKVRLSGFSMQHPYRVNYEDGKDYRVMRYAGKTPANLQQVPIDLVTLRDKSGCFEGDYEGFRRGEVAMIPYSRRNAGCELFEAAYNAEKAGASAVLFYNDVKGSLHWSRIRSSHWSEGDPLMRIPVLSISYALGQTFYAMPSATVNLMTQGHIVVVETFNILCDYDTQHTPTTSTLASNKYPPSPAIIVGAHLDGVPGGPGINDDGSGTATILEIALQMQRINHVTHHPITFAWWGAEEIGLMGSRHFVRAWGESHSDEDRYRRAMMLNLNFDMLGSPNYIPGILDASTAPNPNDKATALIQESFEDYFNKNNLPYARSWMGGGSDYFSFLEVGVPAGGIVTGAGAVKTADERHKFGGIANAILDPCYHKYCDTIENVNDEALHQTSQSACHVIEHFSSMATLPEAFFV